MSTLLRFVPKVGPFKGLGFNNPTPQTEDMYITSINTTVDRYRSSLEAVRTETVTLPNCDLDSGNATIGAEYALTDGTYAKLLDQLSARNFDLATPQLRDNILTYYGDLSLPIETRKDPAHWQSLLAELDRFRNFHGTNTSR